jgi:hypothetical protein
MIAGWIIDVMVVLEGGFKTRKHMKPPTVTCNKNMLERSA